MNLSEQYWESTLSSFTDVLLHFAGKLILVWIVWMIGRKIIGWITEKLLIRTLRRMKIDEDVDKFAVSATKVVLYAVLVLEMISILGLETTSLITLLGSGALAVGLSLQGSLTNFAGGMLLLVFKPFRKGDYIIADSREGTVDSIGLLYTKLHMPDNRVVMLPNGKLTNSNIINVSAEPERRLDIEIGISYDADLKKAKDILQQIMEQEDRILQHIPPAVIVKRLDESCVTLETEAWVRTEDYLQLKAILQEMYKLQLDAAGVAIPYPQMDVHLVRPIS